MKPDSSSVRSRNKKRVRQHTKMAPETRANPSIEYRQARLIRPCYRYLTYKRLIIGGTVVLVLVIVFLVIGLTVNSSETSSTSPSRDRKGSKGLRVKADGGWVRGIVDEDNAWVFKGVPYAKPPVEDLRWRPPQPCKDGECWQGTFNADTFATECVQQELGANKPSGEEDCLVLNVWTPSDSKLNRPVLVYIHGGELTGGSGNVAGEHPTADLLKELDIVGVSINYRLNAFGFLALDALADGSTKTFGNYGFMDQIMALTWVKNNINKFGGNPNRVILLGHSSGGTSIVGMLVSPLARGLFHGAMIMSGSAVFEKTSAAAAQDNKIFLTRANCNAGSMEDIRKCLTGLTAEQIIKAIPWNVAPFWSMSDLTDLPFPGHFNGALATVDGYVVPSPPLVAMGTGTSLNDVPIIIGTTAQEIDYYPGKDFSKRTYLDFEKYVRKKLSRFMDAAKVNEVFKLYHFSALSHATLQYSTVVSDIRVTCPNHVLALNASIGLTSPVYRYVVTNWPSKPVRLPIHGARASPYAFHVWDLQAFFGFPEDLGYVPSEKDKRFMKDLRREFRSFIHTSKVHTPSWKGYPETTGKFSDDGLKVVSAYHKKECEFWLNHGFFPYGWVN